MSKLLFHTRRCGFTLVELIVVIAVMTILASISGLAFRRIAADLRMASAESLLSASLDNARALAIKKNRYVMAVFVPRLINDRTQQVTDIIIAEWRGDSMNANFSESDVQIFTVDRFLPVQGVEVRTLKNGVNVAAPDYTSQHREEYWATSTFLPDITFSNNNSDIWGRVSAILFSPEGRVVTRNSKTAAYRTWVDFNFDGEQTYDPDPDRDPATNDAEVVGWLTNTPDVRDSHYSSMRWLWGVYLHGEGGEPFVNLAPWVTVYDEKKFRTLYPSSSWQSWDERERDYTEFIATTTTPIRFNRYSGVSMK
jgi:prepilin-type N-terminal cleavage/methylation domain-containing protein